MKNKNLLPVFNGDRFDLIALLKNIWNGRSIVIATFVFCLVIGLFIAFFSPVKYRAGSVLLPQAEDQKDLEQLGGLASLAGLNLSNVLGSASGISPDLYPSVIGSYPFLNELAGCEFIFNDESEAISLYEKMVKAKKGNNLIKYTIRLPWTLKDLLFPVEESLVAVDSDKSQQLIVLSRRKAMIFDEIRSSISIDVSDKTGLISVVVEHEDAYASAQIAQKVGELLQEYIIGYKTTQVRNNLEFVEARYEEKKIAFEQAQRLFFDYQDANRNIVTERVGTKFQELSDEYNLSRTIYQNLAQQVEQTRLSVKRETPVFTVIEPVKVPIEKSSPRRTFILLVSIFVGGIAGLVLLYGVIVFRDVRVSWKQN
jgi:hypothetical protein